MNLAPHLIDRLVARVSSRVVDPLVEQVSRWAVESQQRSRRNAMIASTALAQRRAELDDVEEFLAALAGAPVREVAAHAAHG